VKKKLWMTFALGVLVGAAGMFFSRSYVRGSWPFEHRAVNVSVRRPDADPLQANRQWAQPVAGKGLNNTHAVSLDLYRGAQPTADGFKTLEAMGVKSIVNLRNLHSDRDAMEGRGMKYFRLHVDTLLPEDDEVESFVRIMARADNLPVFIHCRQGSDRTGLMVAAYRIVFQGWSKEQAIQEMRDGGYGFHDDFQHLLRDVKELDVAKLRRLAGDAK
jgi:tyrosine-protein phosphatase SIW14